MKYSLGLDIGITSVGWAVLNLDANRIEDLGVRAFNAAEDPKTKAPLAEPRRTARSIRRRLRRRAGRLRRIRDIFVQHGLITGDTRDSAFETRKGKASPWELRANGLDHLLTGEELARALFHIAKRRGFKSNRKKVTDNKDDGDMLEAITTNRKAMADGNYRTAGQMLHAVLEEKRRVRNTTGSYTNTVDRKTLEDEAKTLFACQRARGSKYAREALEQAFLDAYLWQLPFASADRILKMVGNCTFLPEEKRAARNAYHVERFVTLQKINGLTYQTDGAKLRLTNDQRAKTLDLAYSLSKVTYAQLRKHLQFPEDARFTGLSYLKKNKETRETEESLDCEKPTCLELKGYHALEKVCEAHKVWDQVKNSPDLMDDLAHALTFYKTDEDIRKCLEEKMVPEDVIAAALECPTFDKTSNLSLVAIKRILPYLEQYMLYNEACAAAGFDHSNPETHDKLDKLPAVGDDVTRNPVVRRALSQARKVVNAVINRYGSPYRIHIEFARDVGRSAEERGKIQRSQEENRKDSDALKSELAQEFGREMTGTDLAKFRFYREQQCKCAYSLESIDLSRLFEPHYAEIDHIVPYSRSFDDSRANRVLVLACANQEKKNRTPFEYFGHDEPRWANFEPWVRNTIRDPRKRNYLLKKEIDETEWKERSLQDTRYIAREFAAFVRDNLKFADPGVKLPVICVNGQITARTRRLWGLEKHREENDLHHAMDAAVIATLLPHQVEEITRHSKAIEVGERIVDPETGEIYDRPRLPLPWKGFRRELLARLSENPAEAIKQLNPPSYEGMPELQPITVSRMPQRGVSGAIHKETIRSAKCVDSDGKSAVRKSLTSLSNNDLQNLVCKDEADQRLFMAICRRMEEHGGKADKAFAEPLCKPTHDGSPGPVVKGVKVFQPQFTGVNIRGGIADNGGMVRTDIFRKKGKYYLVPVYVSDMISGELPTRAIAAHKPENEWPAVDESYEFLFSLCPYDIVRMDMGDETIWGYYRGTHRANGALKLSMLNDNKAETSYGARNAKAIEKYQIGVLGDYHRVGKEVRLGLANGSDIESGETEDRE